MDKKAKSFNHITTVQVAEQLAGIPWTTPRARQHVVNEVAQSLHKVLIFNNSSTSPFQKWAQGSWHAQWNNLEGIQVCTLYVSITVPEHKIKIRKVRELEWRKLMATTTPTCSPPTEEIQADEDMERYWRNMAEPQEHTHPTPSAITTPNPYATLNREEANASS